jgi:hypothetical protein
MDEQPLEPRQLEQQEPPTPAQRRNPIISGLFVLGLLAVAFFLVKYVSDNAIPDVPGVTLTDMHSIEDLRAHFNADAGAPRLVVLLSPT